MDIRSYFKSNREGQGVAEDSAGVPFDEAEADQEIEGPVVADYLSSTLIVRPNALISDVFIEQFSDSNLTALEDSIMTGAVKYKRDVHISDPRKEMKKYFPQALGLSMFSDNTIQELTVKALRTNYLFTRYGNLKEKLTQVELNALGQTFNDLKSQNEGQEAEIDEEEMKVSSPSLSASSVGPSVESFYKYKTKHNKRKLQEALTLHMDQGVPLATLVKRTQLSYETLRRLVKVAKESSQGPLIQKRCRFKKLHQRAKDYLRLVLKENTEPYTAPHLQRLLKEKFKLIEELGLGFKKVKQTNSLINVPASKLQRQFAARIFIECMYEKKRIINVDESSLNATDYRRGGWGSSKKQLHFHTSQRLTYINIIAGISSWGEFFYTVNQGKNNNKTFCWFLLKVVSFLEQLDMNWRENTVFLIDNASYHKSSQLLNKFQRLKIPVHFLGPYQFKMAPVEKLFSFIKMRNLNPQSMRIGFG